MTYNDEDPTNVRVVGDPASNPKLELDFPRQHGTLDDLTEVEKDELGMAEAMLMETDMGVVSVKQNVGPPALLNPRPSPASQKMAGLENGVLYARQALDLLLRSLDEVSLDYDPVSDERLALVNDLTDYLDWVEERMVRRARTA